MTLYANTDGASRGNPGESGIGFVLRDESGNVLCEASGYIGEATNNAAEYQALIACLEEATEMKCDRLVVRSDSELLVRQLRGTYRVKDPGLKKFYGKVNSLLAAASYEFEIEYVERASNHDADRLANRGIDSKRRLRPKVAEQA